MKSVARIELKPGMVVAEDIRNYSGEVIVPAETELKESHIAKLARHSIMVVPIMEKIDYATTHFEKVRLSEGFARFEECYRKYFPVYKTILMNFVLSRTPFNMANLMKIYSTVSSCAPTAEDLLDYLYNMLPSEDDLTHAHCMNSALIAGVFGPWLGLSELEVSILIQAAFVYDVGKLTIPDSILWKPGKLTDEEKQLVNQHARKGYEMLKDLPVDEHVKLAALQHHERVNGTGYPSGLIGDKIDPYARNISIIDTYEAMSSARVYRQSLNPFQVIAHFEESGGFVRYDSRSLQIILSHLASTQLGMNVRLSDGRKAEVKLINEKALSKPLVKLTDNGSLLDLAQFGLSIDAIF